MLPNRGVHTVEDGGNPASVIKYHTTHNFDGFGMQGHAGLISSTIECPGSAPHLLDAP